MSQIQEALGGPDSKGRAPCQYLGQVGVSWDAGQQAALLQTHVLGSKSPPTSAREDLRTSFLSMAPTPVPLSVPPTAARGSLRAPEWPSRPCTLRLSPLASPPHSPLHWPSRCAYIRHLRTFALASLSARNSSHTHPLREPHGSWGATPEKPLLTGHTS